MRKNLMAAAISWSWRLLSVRRVTLVLVVVLLCSGGFSAYSVLTSRGNRGRTDDLSIHSDDSSWTKKAKEILERTGAQDVSSTGEATADKDDKARVREVA